MLLLILIIHLILSSYPLKIIQSSHKNQNVTQLTYSINPTARINRQQPLNKAKKPSTSPQTQKRPTSKLKVGHTPLLGRVIPVNCKSSLILLELPSHLMKEQVVFIRLAFPTIHKMAIVKLVILGLLRSRSS